MNDIYTGLIPLN